MKPQSGAARNVRDVSVEQRLHGLALGKRAAGVPQISEQEFERLPLRAHTFLAGVPLHDVWAIDLPSPRAGITLDEFLASRGGHLSTPSAIVRRLLNTRFFPGACSGGTHTSKATTSRRPPPTFADRLTPADRARSLAPAGVKDGHFRVVYRFENEHLVELINRTAHAAALSVLVEAGISYRFTSRSTSAASAG